MPGTIDNTNNTKHLALPYQALKQAEGGIAEIQGKDFSVCERSALRFSKQVV